MKYDAKIDFPDVIIDTIISNKNENRHYFQAINKAYDRTINFQKGSHTFRISIDNIQINDSFTKIIIAIYSKKRTGYLFWWRIPVEFNSVKYSTGGNYLKVNYEQEAI